MTEEFFQKTQERQETHETQPVNPSVGQGVPFRVNPFPSTLRSSLDTESRDEVQDRRAG
jgi:hypothetical protein